MKLCACCGRENTDKAVTCFEGGTWFAADESMPTIITLRRERPPQGEDAKSVSSWP